MSDFLDRLAAREIGNGSALAPRLPSLFEPLPQAPMLSLSNQGRVPSRGRDAVVATTAAPPDVPVQPMQVARELGRARAIPPDPPLTSEPAYAMARSLDDTLRSSAPKVTPRSNPPLDRSAAVSTPEHPAATNPSSPVSPRQTRIVPERHAASPSATGSLRPAAVPVFGASRAGASLTPSGQAAARRTPAVPAGNQTGVSSEPVVHVSIGRLEVRAAAITSAAPRRRDVPQPTSLDDYLRQRGDKVSP